MMGDAYREMSNPNKPLNPLLKIQIYQWLEEIRELGEFNMFGLRPELQDCWSLTKKQSTELLASYHDGSLEKFYNEAFPNFGDSE